MILNKYNFNSKIIQFLGNNDFEKFQNNNSIKYMINLIFVNHGIKINMITPKIMTVGEALKQYLEKYEKGSQTNYQFWINGKSLRMDDTRYVTEVFDNCCHITVVEV